MDINRIKYFRVIFEVGSVRKASEILNMTPGALSKAIKVLETELDRALFIPQGRNIIPTDFGKSFYSRSTNLIKEYDALKNTLTSVETSNLFTIASWEVFTSYFLTQFSIDHQKKFKIRVLERTPYDLEKAILENHAEVGITYAPIPHSDLEFIKLGTIEYGVYGVKNKFHKFDNKEIPFAVPITVFPESPTGVKTLDNWPAGVQRKIAFEFELLETALDMARQGGAVVFCPSTVIKAHNARVIEKYRLELIFAAQFPKVKRKVYLVKRKSHPMDSKIKDFIAYLSNSF